MATALSPGGYVRHGQRGVSPPRSVNVQVAVRCRPLNERERAAGERPVLSCAPDRREVQCTPPTAPRKLASASANSKKTYTYDHVFGPAASQADVYDGVVEPIVDEVLQGYNCTVFAYGQTGTGKTHTMEGARDADMVGIEERRLADKAGIIPRAVKQVFDHLRSITDEHSVRVSHMELYNEQLTDLLGPEDSFNDTLRMYEDPHKGTFVQGLEDIVVRSEEEIFTVLDRSALKRRTAETLMNKYSSRSHSVFSITIHIKESTPEGADLLKVGKLNLVDLAGSENVGRSGAVKGRAREAGNINQSLLTLGRVITALVDRHPHVPYRDSKLTRLLQESLGGRNKTCVIATVTPGSSSLEETASTLDYAYRAKSIKNRPTVNQMIAKHVLLKEYTEEIQKLKKELDANRTKNGVFLPPEEFERLQLIANQQKEAISQLESRGEDYEKKTIALKEKLERTQDALARDKRELASTKATLDEVETDLDQTKSALAVISQQREENGYLIRKHVATEDALQTQGAHLQDTLSLCVSDVTALHNRVDAKSKLEMENVKNLAALQQTVDHSVSSIGDSLKAHEAEQLSLSANSAANLTLMTSTIEKNLAVFSTMVDKFSTRLADLDEQHGHAADVLLGSFQEKNQEGLSELREKIAERASAVNAAEKTIAEVGATISRSLESGLKEMRTLCSQVVENSNIQARRQNEFSRDVGQVFSNLESAVAVHRNKQSNVFAALKLASATEATRLRDATAQTEKEIMDQVSSVFARFASDSNSRMETAAATADDSYKTVLNHSTQISGCLVEASESVAAKSDCYTKSLKEEASSLHQAVELCSSQVSSTVASASGEVDNVNLLMKNLAQTTADWQEDAGEILDSAHRAQLRYQEKSQESWADHCQMGNSIMNELLEQSRGVKSEIETSVSDTSAKIDDGLGQGRKLLSRFATQAADLLLSEVNEPVRLHAIAEDQGHKTAPSVRQWPTQGQLASTQDHALLIKNMRAEKSYPDVPLEDFSHVSRVASTSPVASLSSEGTEIVRENACENGVVEVPRSDVGSFHGDSSSVDLDPPLKTYASNSESDKEGEPEQVSNQDLRKGSDGAEVVEKDAIILSDTTNRRVHIHSRRIPSTIAIKKPSGIPGPRSRGRRRVGQ